MLLLTWIMLGIKIVLLAGSRVWIRPFRLDSYPTESMCMEGSESGSRFSLKIRISRSDILKKSKASELSRNYISRLFQIFQQYRERKNHEMQNIRSVRDPVFLFGSGFPFISGSGLGLPGSATLDLLKLNISSQINRYKITLLLRLEF